MRGTLHEEPCAFLTISLSILLGMRNVSKLQRKSKQTFQVQQRFLVDPDVYETMQKNIVEPDGPQMTIWRTRIACWIPKATNTLSGFVILTVFRSCNNGCTKTPQRFVIRTQPVLLLYNNFSGTQRTVVLTEA